MSCPSRTSSAMLKDSPSATPSRWSWPSALDRMSRDRLREAIQRRVPCSFRRDGPHRRLLEAVTILVSSGRTPWSVAVLVAALGAACSSTFTPPAPPSEAEARAFVGEAVRLAEAGRFVELCEMGGGNCEEILEGAGADNVPTVPPTIARVYVVPNVHHADGSWSAGGQMVEMCGTDGNGARYRTQMLVFRDHRGELIAIEPIYWSGIRIIAGQQPPIAGAGHPAFEC